MFFGKKMGELADHLEHLQEDVKILLKRQEQWADSVESRLQGFGQEMGEYRKQFHRQSQSVEDLLDEVTGQQEQWGTFIKGQQEQWDSFERERQEQKRREDALVSLVSVEREQIRLLEKMVLGAVGSDETARNAWENQFRLMEEESKRAMLPCAMEETGTVGEKADYSLHEVKKVVDTQEKGRDGVIAEVYSPGRLYCGRLLKKADVAVYRFREGEEVLPSDMLE